MMKLSTSFKKCKTTSGLQNRVLVVFKNIFSYCPQITEYNISFHIVMTCRGAVVNTKEPVTALTKVLHTIS